MSGRRVQIETAEVFEPLLKPSRYKGAYGGRGSGKSHFFAGLDVERCILRSGTNIACVREVQKTLRDSVKKLIEAKIVSLGALNQFEIQSDRIRTPGGGSIIFQGMQDHTAESIKSLEDFDIAHVEEAQTLSARSLELLRPTIRKKDSELWFGWNPRNPSDPVDRLLRGVTPPKDAIVVRANYSDNNFFPDVLKQEREHDRLHNPDRYAHIWLGEYEPQAIGAIWTRQVFHEHRVSKPPNLERIVVAVDPAVTDTENSDYHGVAVCAIGKDQRGYVLEDGSLHGPPHQWATRAIALYDKYDADAVVIEVNQGGDMVRHTLESVRRGVRIIEVRATRGKHVRAEPISALYSLGRISHVGTLIEMEDQFCKFTPSGYAGSDSPDRAEAAIWALTELFPRLTSEPAMAPVEPRCAEGAWMG